ncbi:type II toxin-antitoxin system Phd/YefM family antitoxin [Schaalia vaccimaxillae]|uniref:type II toxin-antitoxin system Phd/YefM family antitoxin n=1 Tax=Schaalia vaccimaxillae TaxID=183916 RepID=UPI0003B44AB8|nr:type II toxin-antitoxin system prevent-host-death family antitoxin [Schaalia vaccimaxillae]
MSNAAITPEGRTVTLRNLNQHSGQIVADVRSSGHAVTITDRGRPVARLIPFEEETTPLQRLRLQGRVRMPRTDFRVLPKHSMPNGMTLRELLDEDRDES